MTITELTAALSRIAVQNIIIFPNGRSNIVWQWGALKFETIDDLTKWLQAAVPPEPAKEGA